MTSSKGSRRAACLKATNTLLLLLVVMSRDIAVWPSTARADVYQVVPMQPPPLLPPEFIEEQTAQNRIITLDGVRVRARTWQAHAGIATIRAAIRRTVVSEYAAWQRAKRKDSKFDTDSTAYWALPRVVLNPNWMAVVRFSSDGLDKTILFGNRQLPVAPIQLSHVALVLPAGDPSGAFIWELEMPTRAVFSLLSIKTSGDAPGRDHDKAGRPAESTRTFSLEESNGGIHHFTASYATAGSPTAAVEALAANLVRNGFQSTLRSVQSDSTRIELKDRATELTLFAATASSTPGIQGQVVISATEPESDR